MDITVVLIPLLKMAIMIFLGYIGIKGKYISPNIKDSLSKLMLRYANPLLAVTSISGQTLSGDLMKNAGVFMIAALCYYAVMLLVGFASSKMFKLKPDRASVHTCIVTFVSIAYMGYPLVRELFGEEGFFYTVMVVLVGDVLFYTVGMLIMARSSGDSMLSALKKMVNPITIGVFVGLFMLIFGLKFPPVVQDSLSQIGGMLTPLAMLFVGICLAEVDLKNIYKRWQLFLTALVKMLLMPFLLGVVLRLLKVDSMVFNVLPLIMALPSLSVLAAVANEYGGDTGYATEGVFITTILCLMILPILYALLQMIV